MAHGFVLPISRCGGKANRQEAKRVGCGGFVLQKLRGSHRDTEIQDQERALSFLSDLFLLRVFVPLWRIAFLRKTEAVMRFDEHGGAAGLYTPWGLPVNLRADRFGIRFEGGRIFGQRRAARGALQIHVLLHDALSAPEDPGRRWKLRARRGRAGRSLATDPRLAWVGRI